MTARQCFEGLLTELSKVNAPSMLLADFNYFFNKAVNQYINKRYNIYDINQQTTDDLRVLKATSILTPTKISNNLKISDGLNILDIGAGTSKLFGATFEVNLPLDYLHLLNCICIYKLDKQYKCYDKDDVVQFSAKRLTGDSWSQVINDFYNRPLPERPYYYIHNVNISNDLPTNPSKGWESGTDQVPASSLIGTMVKSNIMGESLPADDGQNAWLMIGDKYLLEEDGVGCCIIKDPTNIQDRLYVKIENGIITGASKTKPQTQAFSLKQVHPSNELPRTISINQKQTSLVQKSAMNRYGNASPVRMEIRYGHDSSVFKLVGVAIDYIKSPQHIRLTQEQVNLTEDTSQMMEFPDYVCQEIINELVHLVMETTGNPRLQTHSVVTESIANPAQQQAPAPRG